MRKAASTSTSDKKCWPLNASFNLGTSTSQPVPNLGCREAVEQMWISGVSQSPSFVRCNAASLCRDAKDSFVLSGLILWTRCLINCKVSQYFCEFIVVPVVRHFVLHHVKGRRTKSLNSQWNNVYRGWKKYVFVAVKGGGDCVEKLSLHRACEMNLLHFDKFYHFILSKT